MGPNRFPEILAMFSNEWELLELDQVYKICGILVDCGYKNATESIDTMFKIIFIIQDLGLIELDTLHTGKLQAKLKYGK